MRLAKRSYQKGDFLPPVGSHVLMSSANQDITSDQDRSYNLSIVIGYSPCGNFVCFQKEEGCWPFVEKLENCWFYLPTLCSKCGIDLENKTTDKQNETD